MESIGRGVLVSKVWQPLLQIVRNSRRVNLKRPRPPHYERALIEALAKPIYPKPIEYFLSESEKCLKAEEKAISQFKIDNPFENLLAKECLSLFNESALVAVCHKNPIKAEPAFNMIIRFRRENMVVKNYGRRIVELAVKGTKFEPILTLYTGKQATIFCNEPKVEELLKCVKKTPEFILLAGIVDGYFANVNQIDEYVRLNGDISQARAQLVSVMNSAAQCVVTNLNQHQMILTSSLDQYADMLQKGSADNSRKAEPPPQSVDDSSETPSS